MKRRFAVMMLAALACSAAVLIHVAPTHHTFTIKQHVLSGACTLTSATCTVNFSPAPSTGDLVVVCMMGNVTGEYISAESSGVMTLPPASTPSGVNATNSAQSTSCAYLLSVGSFTSAVTITRNNSTSMSWRVWGLDASYTSGPLTVASPNNNSNGAASTAPAFPSLTLNGNNLVIEAIFGGTSSACNSTPASTLFDGNGQLYGVCVIANTSSISGSFTTSSAKAAVSGMAFAEATTSGHPWGPF